jgi:gliding motility-associated peptidyl-prolyl isomerase
MKYPLLFILTFLFFFSCKPSEARRPVSKNSGAFIDASIERSKELNSKEYAQIEAVIKDSDNTFISSDTKTPVFGDLIEYKYTLKTLEGQIIYIDKALETHSYYVDQQELFTGLREGLKLMKEGESITFMFPSQKAYGYYGDNNKIGRNVPLICDVSLLKLTTN